MKTNLIKSNSYIIKNNAYRNLIRLGFVRIKHDEDIYFSYCFPVYKYKNIPVLFCELKVFTNNHDVRIDVYDNNGAMYNHFYNSEYGNTEPMVKMINIKIANVLKKMGVIEKRVYGRKCCSNCRM